ncbi:ferrochelatase [Blastococcus sp. Marseille-P5729]|uniref:ferrochelatase n=1 Tax=Blastococcus sp. Marseille-P5729 TaxID=2086582 RepID=UPI000D1038B0|nr:ferrochelatase [Blastococcus sp. Marseille-P5729]
MSAEREIDAVVVASFGGPEGPDEVVPFLRRVTAGRDIPDERLKVVGEHYFHFGGVSPINEINRGIRARLQAELDARGLGLPVYWGNRNAAPFLGDTAQEMAEAGVRRGLVLATSAYGGASACRQYHADIATAVAAAGGRIQLEKLPQTYHTEAFAQMNADAVRRALEELGRDGFDERTRLVLTAHSVPTKANADSGPRGGLYREQVETVAAEVARRVGADRYDVAWQSRSGAPHVPWLEPDICDHLATLPDQGVDAVVVSPIGFVSDHMEVIWDLDTEAKRVADGLGLAMARAKSASDDPRFITLYADLIQARVSGSGPQPPVFCEPLQGATGIGVDGAPCAPGCCEA